MVVVVSSMGCSLAQLKRSVQGCHRHCDPTHAAAVLKRVHLVCRRLHLMMMEFNQIFQHAIVVDSLLWLLTMIDLIAFCLRLPLRQNENETDNQFFERQVDDATTHIDVYLTLGLTFVNLAVTMGAFLKLTSQVWHDLNHFCELVLRRFSCAGEKSESRVHCTKGGDGEQTCGGFMYELRQGIA